jgi:putative endopeptidase
MVPRFSTNYIDGSADPAKDFYRYACGVWCDDNPVPPDKTRWSSLDELQELNFRRLREILEDAARTSSTTASPVQKMVGDFFASAMDRQRRDLLRFRPLSSDLRVIARTSSKASFATLLASLHGWGVPALFGTRVSPDDKNSSVYALRLYQGGLSLPDRDYYLRRRFKGERDAYLSHMVRMFTMLGEKRPAAEAASDSVMKIETFLARASKTRTALRDPLKNYHKFTIEALTKRYRSFPWELYFSHRQMSRVSYVVVGQPRFFDAIDTLLRRKLGEEMRTYLRWHLLNTSAPYLHTEAEDEHFDFFKRKLLGQKQPEPEWRRAARAIDSWHSYTQKGIGEALGQLYVERYFPPEARAKMVDLVEELKAVFRDRLKKVPWMTEKTRRLALAKFDRFTTKIGHPEKFRDYSSVGIRRDDFFGNFRRAAAFEGRRKAAQIGMLVDKSEWLMTPPTVNAYFHPTFNEIVFPAGILQPPLFDFTMDDAVNLGGIGTWIGHEMTHGYDDEGRKYDADGNLHDWWSKADTKEFEARAKKIAEQYSEFEPLPGMKVNGMLTRGENIADLGSVSIAYEALRRRLDEGRTPRTKVDGFTPEQRFFLSYGQTNSNNIRDEDLRRKLTVDEHSPDKFRVIGPLANLPEFWEAFNIPPGSAMRRPEELRVEIW